MASGRNVQLYPRIADENYVGKINVERRTLTKSRAFTVSLFFRDVKAATTVATAVATAATDAFRSFCTQDTIPYPAVCVGGDAASRARGLRCHVYRAEGALSR